MPFASVASTQANTQAAVQDCVAQAREQFGGAVQLALAFFSPHHRKEASRLAEILSADLKPQVLLGCPGETIIAGDQEIEKGPALALWLARWPGQVQLSPFHLTMEQTSEGLSLLGWPDALTEAQPAQSVVLTLGDPFTFPVDDFLQQVDEENPGLRVVGGMASGAQQIGESPLIIGDRWVNEGAVCVLLQGDVKARSLVSQGCRPIGKPMVVTKVEENIILELGGKPPLAQLQQLWPELPARDQRLVQEGLHLGRVINEYRDSFQRGDFLIRNVLGVDRDTGGMAITDQVRVGQTVQFHVRDANTADEDLRDLLQIDAQRHPAPPSGALLFSCNGRGSRLFSKPHHDVQALQALRGQMPVAGFFAAGELGPVGKQNFIHGFTASLVMFDE
jgi:small ligand-binding sensory domain FIST